MNNTVKDKILLQTLGDMVIHTKRDQNCSVFNNRYSKGRSVSNEITVGCFHGAVKSAVSRNSHGTAVTAELRGSILQLYIKYSSIKIAHRQTQNAEKC